MRGQGIRVLVAHIVLQARAERQNRSRPSRPFGLALCGNGGFVLPGYFPVTTAAVWRRCLGAHDGQSRQPLAGIASRCR